MEAAGDCEQLPDLAEVSANLAAEEAEVTEEEVPQQQQKEAPWPSYPCTWLDFLPAKFSSAFLATPPPEVKIINIRHSYDDGSCWFCKEWKWFMIRVNRLWPVTA